MILCYDLAAKINLLDYYRRRIFALRVARWSFSIFAQSSKYDGALHDDFESGFTAFEEMRFGWESDIQRLQNAVIELGEASLYTWSRNILDVLAHVTRGEDREQWELHTRHLIYSIHQNSKIPELEIKHVFLCFAEQV